MKKETLTTDIIKREIKAICLKDIKTIIAGIIILTVFIFAMIALTSALMNSLMLEVFRKKVIMTFIYVVYAIGLGIYVTLLIKKLKLLSSKNIQIVTDKLVSNEDNLLHMLFYRRTWGNKLYYLNFARYGCYCIPDSVTQKNYEWSELYCMSANGVYNYSNIGDEFYLVLYGKKIILAYNTKLFELK